MLALGFGPLSQCRLTRGHGGRDGCRLKVKVWILTAAVLQSACPQSLSPTLSLFSALLLQWQLLSASPLQCSPNPSLLFYPSSYLVCHAVLPGWLAGRTTLLSFSSRAPVLSPVLSFTPPPFPSLSDTPASSPSLCSAASSLQQASGLFHQSPLSSPALRLTQSILYGLIYLPSLLPSLSVSLLLSSEAELLTACRFHGHGLAG